jgi:pimeloyl-ACP methyl ester carboxylesterase
VLGMKTAHKYPEKLHAYVGVAQIINNYEQQKISYNYVVEEAEKEGSLKVQNSIKAIGPPPYDTPEGEYEKARYIIRYGGFIRDNPIKKMIFIMLSYLTSPEYSLLEGVKTINGDGLKFTMDSRYEEIRNVNFTQEIKSIKVPIYFFVGKYDMTTPTVQIESFYNGLEAEKGKTLVIFDKSAHLPILEENPKYQEILINVVLKESQDK